VVEKIEVHDVEEVKEFQVTQLIPEVQVSNMWARHRLRRGKKREEVEEET
jgi:hypothetical protein